MLANYLSLVADIADIVGWLTIASVSLYFLVLSWRDRRHWIKEKREGSASAPASAERPVQHSIGVDRSDGLAASVTINSAVIKSRIESGEVDYALAAALEEYAPLDPRTMQIFWGTNRDVEFTSDTLFGGERGQKLLLGVAAVRIPENHRIGRVEQPFELTVFTHTLWRQTRRSDQHFMLSGFEVCDEDEWCALIEETDETEAFVFVHGFNTSFSEALFRCAQIAWDLKLDAIPFLFSWPSRGNVLDYLYDRESAMGARSYFLEFLEKITAETQVKTVHILAHSMGNQVVLEALAHHSHQEKPLLVSEVLMAAPDVDADVYKTLTAKIRSAVRGMTLYASSVDRALAASRTLAGDMFRAGDVSKDGPTVVPGVDAIDVTGLGADLLGLNHGVFAQARSILNDVSIVVASGHRPPHKRLADIRCVPEGSSTPTYWRYAD